MTDLLSQSILERLARGDSSQATAGDLFAQLVEDDPRLSLLARWLQQREAAEAARSAAVEKPVPEQNELELGELHAEIEDLSRSMVSELEVLRSRNDMLAAALGACHLCWGEDAVCPYCGGIGAVGTFVIDRAIFAQVVEPALQQLGSRARLAGDARKLAETDRSGDEGGERGN